VLAYGHMTHEGLYCLFAVVYTALHHSTVDAFCVNRVTQGRHDCSDAVHAALLGHYIHWWHCGRFLLTVPDISSWPVHRQLLHK